MLVFLLFNLFFQLSFSECTDSGGSSICLAAALQGGCSSGSATLCQKTCGLCTADPGSCVGFEYCANNEYVLEDATCFGDPCHQGDKVNCCAVRARCSGFQFCDEGWNVNSNANCATDTCEEADKTACCIANECQGFTGCASGEYALDFMDCADQCTAAECCRSRAPCTTYNSCSAEDTVLENNLCERGECVADDYSNCCLPPNNCDGFGCSADQYVRPQTVCTGGDDGRTCTTEICCAPKANCPADFAFCVEGIETIETTNLCNDDTCSEEDNGACCMDRAPCSSFSFTCPAGEGEVAGIRRDAKCAGATCEESDADTCCMLREPCTKYHDHPDLTCPDVNDTPDTSSFCEGETCNADDEINCCDNYCAGFSHCPTGDLRQVVDPSKKCELSECSVEDVSNCCVDPPTCDTFPCDGATEFVRTGQSCGEIQCTHDECCGVRNSCDGYPDCASDEIYDPAQLCATSTCTIDDKETCCYQRESCVGYRCLEGTYADITKLCAGNPCEDSDRDVCCVPQPRCKGSVACEGTQFSTEAYCAESPCVDSDKEQCCGARASCHGYKFCTEAFTYVRKDSLCATDTCDWLDDRPICCAPCTTKIMGVLNSDQDCPLDIPNCHLNVHVENNGEDYYTLTTLGSFDMPVCPGDKLFLSAHGTLAQDHTFFYACEVSNGKLDMVRADVTGVTIVCNSPLIKNNLPQPVTTTTTPTQVNNPCHRNHEYYRWDGSEYEVEGCGGETEVELSDGQYWPTVNQPAHPNHWAWHWWGQEMEGDDFLRAPRRPIKPSERVRHTKKTGNPMYVIAGMIVSMSLIFIFVGLYTVCCKAKHDPYNDLDLDLITKS